MKKIGILTLNGNNNYGNKLQNYALKKILEDKNYYVETIWFRKSYVDYIKTKIKYIFPIKKLYKRNIYFERFTIKYLNRKYYNNNNISDLYDYFIVGSEQVWNYNFSTFNTNYFLDFSKDKNKNISYAASFGIDIIRDELKEKFKNGLNNFSFISVREEKGKEIVDNLLKKDISTVCLDPTLLINSDVWKSLEKKPKSLKSKKYILNYFLGNISDEIMEIIKMIAKDNECEIINILDKNGDYYISGPSEFLYLERNAFLICTDSFHSSVFAFLFDRPFIVFDRDDDNANMNSRINTLLSTFKLNDRKFNSNLVYNQVKHDYSEAYKILEVERRKSINFINNALKESRSE